MAHFQPFKSLSQVYRPPSVQGGPPASSLQSSAAKLATVCDSPKASSELGSADAARLQWQRVEKVGAVLKAEPIDGIYGFGGDVCKYEPGSDPGYGQQVDVDKCRSVCWCRREKFRPETARARGRLIDASGQN